MSDPLKGYCDECGCKPCRCKTKGKAKPKITSCEAPVALAEFMAREHPEPKFLVPGLVLENSISCIGGRPRGAKTPLAIQLGLSCAWAAPWCEGMEPSTKTDVLHLGLERGEQVLQKQIGDQLKTAGRPPPDGYYVQWSWPRFDQGGIELLDHWLGGHPEVGLVTLDPWALLRPKEGKKGGVDAYHEDYEDIGKLRDLRNKHGVAFLMTMHTNQNREPIDMTASLYGNTGFAGALDMVGLVINKKKLIFEGTLIERQSWDMEFTYPRWSFVAADNGHDSVIVLNDKDLHVLDVVRQRGPGKHLKSVITNLCDPAVMATSKKKNAVRMAVERSLKRLAEDGKVVLDSASGCVELAPEGDQ